MEKSKTKVLTHELCADMISWSLTIKDKILPFSCFPFEQRCATMENISAAMLMTNRAC